MSYHNMRGFFSGKAHAVSVQFDDWLKRAITAAPAARDEMLATWTTAPGARDVHPREEHLLPLMVIAGAAGSDLGQIPWSKDWMRVRVSAARFG
jgi:aromatic ring-opening dioxygenase catalytic subunit (LigB family)